MDSLDAQCLIIQLTGAEMPAPDLWRHDRSGSLHCQYSGGEHSFTWDPEAVAAMARRWRQSKAVETPEEVRAFLDAQQRFELLMTESELRPPDAFIHDLGQREVRAVWEDEQLIVVIEELREPVLDDA